jgi:hypothetical protein
VNEQPGHRNRPKVDLPVQSPDLSLCLPDGNDDEHGTTDHQNQPPPFFQDKKKLHGSNIQLIDSGFLILAASMCFSRRFKTLQSERLLIVNLVGFGITPMV